MGPTPRVNILDPEQLKEIFSKIYDFRKPNANPLVKLIATGLPNYDGEKWATHRKIINPAFHLEKLKVTLFLSLVSCSFLSVYICFLLVSIRLYSKMVFEVKLMINMLMKIF